MKTLIYFIDLPINLSTHIHISVWQSCNKGLLATSMHLFLLMIVHPTPSENTQHSLWSCIELVFVVWWIFWTWTQVSEPISFPVARWPWSGCQWALQRTGLAWPLCFLSFLPSMHRLFCLPCFASRAQLSSWVVLEAWVNLVWNSPSSSKGSCFIH